MKGILYLIGAILTEVFGSTMLKLSQGFSQLLPSIGVLIGFGCAFTFLSLALKTIELSSAYATWSGVGTALTALVGLVLFNETISTKGYIGLALVICGVIVLNQSKKQKNETKAQLDQTEWTS
ncbi:MULTISPECIES: SMR family multidrug efflux transporter EbrB [Bacillus]|uniref:SMR family multidrug efflux transporter EbrB n=1 Tax=Bacillus TaxID=1386 RepID=UPI0005CA453F|nr:MULTISPECIES: multidrug efflux SMR transporter [Bacillus]KAB3537223.1 multidrug efflux SMR transporter [Bacillus safensis]KAB3544628.1 multidrug efflux SMR transporter [Bacillus safensis]KIZ56289.1 multidrug transporter [Bacillus safensis]MBR0612808.1 multidrug efflux SMR transporter [Bacillus safensis]MBR0635366.1 multidrug efflux SMR transporter [Bacillus safensis]